MADDLDKLTTGALLDDLGKHRRYREQLIASTGLATWNSRDQGLWQALQARGVDPSDTVPPIQERAPLRLQPLHDHVVVLPTEAEAVTAGGILVPDTAKEKPMQGEVLAVGPGRHEQGQTVLMTVTPGETVLFGRYAGTEVHLDGLRVLILREEDVLGILTPAP
jgi:chaperonin GroES